MTPSSQLVESPVNPGRFTATNRVLSAIAVGMSPIDVAITPNGAFAYVANSGSNDLSVIEVATNRVLATVKVGVRPQ